MATARVVVIGGGNMGASVLYHLAKEGWTDCVLVEKAELTSSATWHAVGLVSRMTAGHALGTCHDYAVDLYKRIEDETEQGVSWHNCGSLRVGATDAHRDWLLHTRDGVLARGQECQCGYRRFQGVFQIRDHRARGRSIPEPAMRQQDAAQDGWHLPDLASE